jgi:hypothetical protein
MTPETNPKPLVAEAEPPSPPAEYRWYHKMAGLITVIFYFEMGVFLLIFPWASDWDLNYFSGFSFWSNGIWASPYFRGAVSGLGIVNILISFVEVFRLRRFSVPPPPR